MRRNTGRFVIGALFILLGLNFLFDINIFRYVWPALLIFLGYRIITRGEGEESFRSGDFEEVSQDRIDEDIVFNEVSRRIISDDFQGGKITAVFAGGELDLSQAEIKDEARLKVETVFGGFKIIVPKDWLVTSSTTGVFGAFSNRTKTPKKGMEKGRLLVSGSAVFGGGEIVNAA